MSAPDSIREWLASQGFEQYIDLFQREQIDLEALQQLTEANMKDLGLPMGHRVKMMKAIQALASLPEPPVPQSIPGAPSVYTPKHLADKILTTRASLEGERKQVTVMFCDIANSTGLAEQLGAETMHGVLNRFFDLALAEVHRFEGTINQFLGDGFMALFGAPLAHEDHARRAVLAGLAVRGMLQRGSAQFGLEASTSITLRLGIHTGPVVVGSIGDNLRMDYTAIGDTTNLAARLQQNAPVNQILISESTARLVKGFVDLEQPSPITVKGKSESISAYVVLAKGARRSRIDPERSLSPFVGRDRELGSLADGLAESRKGLGQVVGIIGEPGVGKSRLVYEFGQMLRNEGILSLEGWCLSFGQSISYLPIIDLLRAICAIEDIDTPAQIAQKVGDCVQDAALLGDDPVPYLLHLLGVAVEGSALGDLAAEAIQARTNDALLRLIMAHARRQPIVILIEDLHWMDRESEQFLAALVESIAAAPVMLLTTSRPGYSAAWVGKSYATQVALKVLSLEDSRKIVESAADRDQLNEGMAASILRKAEGNPLFLEELAIAVRESSGAELAGALPDTIHGVLAARVDRLPEQTKRVLQTAAVLGREFSYRLLEALCPKEIVLRPNLMTLKRQEFLYERNEADGSVFTFKHVLTQEVAYDSLLATTRRGLHEAAGAAIERLYPARLEERYELLAFHYFRSSNRGKALEFLELANRKAAKSNAMVTARTYFEDALQLFPHMEDTLALRRRKIEFLVDQAHVHVLTNGAEAYDAHLARHEEDAISLDDGWLLGKYYACWGHCHLMAGLPAKSADTLRRAVALCNQSDNMHGSAHAYVHLQWAHYHMSECDMALEIEPYSLQALRVAPDSRLFVYSMTASALACAMLGLWDVGIEKAEAALMESRGVNDKSLESFTFTFSYASLCRQRGQIAEAIGYGKHAVQCAQNPAEKLWAETRFGWALLVHDPDAAIELLEPILSAYSAARSVWQEGFAAVPLGEAYYRKGRLMDARQLLERAVDILAPRKLDWLTLPARRLLAEVALANGDLAKARTLFEQVIRDLDRLNCRSELTLAWSGYGRLLSQLNEHDAASAFLSKAREYMRELGMVDVRDAHLRRASDQGTSLGSP